MSDGSDSLQLNTLRRIDLIEKEENGQEASAEKVSEARSADIIPFSKSED